MCKENNIRKHIKWLLRLNNLQTDKKSIDYVYDEIDAYDSLSLGAVEDRFYYIIINKESSIPFYYLAYNLRGLHDDVIVYLIVERLRNKKLSATRREIDELCYQAQCLFDEGKAEDFTHACNIVIKIFSRKEWNTPTGFLEKFNHYANDIKK